MPAHVAANSYTLNYAATPKAGEELNVLFPSKYVPDTPSSECLVHKIPEVGTDIFLLLLEERKIHGT